MAGRAYYRLSEFLSTIIPNTIVTDAAVIREYYLKQYRKPSVMIAYGADCTPTESTAVLDQLKIRPRDYFLYVSRLEPENNAHLVVQAFEEVRTEKQLLIIGNAPYAHGYIERLKATNDPRIQFPGAIYGVGYRELQSHAFVYIHATEVGGTHPALIEAMAAGNCVLVYDTPENREVVADCGLYFCEAKSLSEQIRLTLENLPLVESMRSKARDRARTHYSWSSITDQYEALLRQLCR
jgi:glycosyltransferase involved in cell wall biosynthesis